MVIQVVQVMQEYITSNYSSIIVQLNQGQGFYYASHYVGNNIFYCYFGGKLEGTFS